MTERDPFGRPVERPDPGAWLPPAAPKPSHPAGGAGAAGPAPAWAPPAGSGDVTTPIAPPTGARFGAYELAGFGHRAGAAGVDFAVRLGIAIIGLLLGCIAYAGGSEAGEIGLLVGLGVGFVVGSLVYAPMMMARTNGRTLGHKATGTRIVNADGRPMTGGKAFVREVLVKALLIETGGSFFFVLPVLINYLMPIFDDGNEALHDKMCSTKVILDP